MAAKIEQLEVAPCVSELHADDTALYRISGWALKSCIDNVKKTIKYRHTCPTTRLFVVTKTQFYQGFPTTGSSILGSWGLTFVQPHLLPWLNAVEASMKLHLCQSGYTKYGKDIFQVRYSLYIHAIDY